MRHALEFHRRSRGRRSRRHAPAFRIALALVVAAGGVAGITLADSRSDSATGTMASVREFGADREIGRRFGLCPNGGGANCVVDGDTFRVDGERIRIADIDAPETHPPRCAEEARLGAAATRRLQALLNLGPVRLEIAGRATDRYGRKLRVVRRGGRSLGAQLVHEGLAREWTGRRRPWC